MHGDLFLKVYDNKVYDLKINPLTTETGWETHLIIYCNHFDIKIISFEKKSGWYIYTLKDNR